MKKILITLAMIATVGTMSAFAGRENVTPKVLNAFNSDFNSAKEVQWTSGNNYYEAAFVFNGKHVFAFYNADGEMLAVSRYLSSPELPLKLQSDLKKNYSGYWITDLFEVSNNDGTSYYITLENADTKITLKTTNDNSWKKYKKINKV